ncbi:MAG: TetR/AcrR family transcriptional regulator, partial [Clostridiales bacterium]|nr:TetR/AcrR family transcriptional regulator [Clostridiales bacterium]
MRNEEESKRKIIDAGLKCFAASGYQKTSIEEVARDAGVSKALIFHYFGTKTKLYKDLFDYFIGVVTEELARAKGLDDIDFFARLKAQTEAKLRIMTRNPSLLNFALRIMRTPDKVIAELLEKHPVDGILIDYFGG